MRPELGPTKLDRGGRSLDIIKVKATAFAQNCTCERGGGVMPGCAQQCTCLSSVSPTPCETHKGWSCVPQATAKHLTLAPRSTRPTAQKQTMRCYCLRPPGVSRAPPRPAPPPCPALGKPGMCWRPGRWILREGD